MRNMSGVNTSELKAKATRHLADNDLQAALDLYAQVCLQDPDDVDAKLVLARIYQKSGNLDKAISILQQANILHPENTTTLKYLAELQLNASQVLPCIKTCQRLLSLTTEDATAYSLLGTALQTQGNLFEASLAHERAVQLAPENAFYCYKYACVLQTLGKLNQALDYFRQARDRAPEFTAALGGLVRIHDQLGNANELGKLVEPLLQAGQRDPMVLPTLASIAPRFNLTQQTIDLTEQHLAAGRLPVNVQARLHWALGTLYESINEYDKAFHHHSVAKPVSAGGYDAKANSALTDRIMAQYTREFLAGAATATTDTSRPVFIVGMPRSGTSLVEQILACHSAVHGAGELPHLSWIVNAIARMTPSRTTYPEGTTELTTQRLNECATYYTGMLDRIAPTAQRVTDKMPHNFRFLGLVQQLFPHSRIIHVQRDPLDTCLSCYFQEFSAAHTYTRTLQDLGTHYLDYRRLMQHWSDTLAIPLLTIQYEDLVANLEHESRRLLKFCGLDWEDQCLEFHTNERIVQTLSAEQVNQPIYTSSVGRWQYYAEQLDGLKRMLI